MKPHLRLLLAAVIAGLCSTAVAQVVGPEPQTTSGGIRWVSGGVGFDETFALKQMEGGYNLRLLFAVQGSGAYLSEVPVIIQNRQGQSVFEETAHGPRLLAQFPPGPYTITAESGGKVVSRQVTVPRSGSVDTAFYFPDAPER
ncbi:MAG: hypothetical protein JNM48_02230 [Rhodospirillales bacterium]|nr:hypothetical protein [Rhodospirillales bacterium]